MTCHELDERLDDWVDGALPAAAASEVEAHLLSCALCRERERRPLVRSMALLGR